MNQNVIKMFSRKKPKHIISKEFHLWEILQKLSKLKASSSIAMSPNKLGHITITFAPDGERARKVVRRSNYRMTGKMPSSKNGRMVQWESHYEKNSFQLLEVSPCVTAYREQPAIFKYQDADGVLKTHYPDIYVVLKNGTKLFIEVKPDSARQDQDLLNREDLLKDLLSNKGYKYIQIYPDQIESFHYLENAQHMLWHIKSAPLYPVIEKIRRFISINQKISLGILKNFLNDRNAKSWIFYMLVVGVICCDLSMPLIDSTFLSMKGGY